MPERKIFFANQPAGVDNYLNRTDKEADNAYAKRFENRAKGKKIVEGEISRLNKKQ